MHGRSVSVDDIADLKDFVETVVETTQNLNPVGSRDVVGSATSIDHGITTVDGTTGKLIQSSGVVI